MMIDFEDGVLKCVPRLRRYAFLFTRTRDTADAIMVKVLEQAVRERDQLAERPDLQLSLYMILHQHLSSWINTPAADMSDQEPEPDETVRLEDILELLSFEERAALLLTVVEGLSIDQTADVMETDREATAQTLRRARSLFYREAAKAELYPLGQDEDDGESSSIGGADLEGLSQHRADDQLQQ